MDRSVVDANQDLDALLAEDFSARYCILSSVSALRTVLSRSPEVRVLAKDHKMGILTESVIRAFVSKGCNEFKSGERSRFRYAFAALAVVLSNVHSDFAEEFLVDLARTNVPELEPACRMARHCATARKATIMPKVVRSFVYNSDPEVITEDYGLDSRNDIVFRPQSKITHLEYAFA